ncbi:MAG: MFS transporter [Pseudomonadota bacterium]
MLKTGNSRPTDGAMGQEGLVALITLGTAGVMTFLAMPVIAAALVNVMGASERDVGLFSTVQLITLSCGCLLSTFLPRGQFRRFGIAALAVMIVCDLLCLTHPSWTMLLVLRGIGGAAGGVAVSQATAAMARTRNAERSFGLFLALQTILSIVCVYAMPPIIARFGFAAAYGVLLAFDLVAMLLVLTRLKAISPTAVHQMMPGNDMAGWLRSAGVLISILCFFTGVGALWTFLAILGQGIGLDGSQIALVLSISKLIAFGASFLPGIIGSRFGRIPPILVSAVILMAAVQVFAVADAFTTFVIATAMFSFGWYVIYPFQLGALGQVDHDGRPMLAAAALTGAGLGLGPALTVLGPGGPAGIYLIATLAFLGAGVAAIAALSRTSPPVPAIAQGS